MLEAARRELRFDSMVTTDCCDPGNNVDVLGGADLLGANRRNQQSSGATADENKRVAEIAERLHGDLEHRQVGILESRNVNQCRRSSSRRRAISRSRAWPILSASNSASSS